MIISLPEAQLKLTFLQNGQLLLGELGEGQSSKTEILEGLKANGITCGYLSDNIEKLSKGYAGQLPIARSEIRIDLVKYTNNFTNDINLEGVDPYKVLTSLHNQELGGMVMAGQRLLTMISTSKRILLKPDGTEIILSDAGTDEIRHFCGNNVHVNKKGNAIFSTIDGVAQITTLGKVSVYPFEVHNNIGKIHGKIDSDHALLIQGDITGGANISSKATLIVRGLIRSSTIHCGGDLDCLNGLDNILQGDEGDIRVEQNLRTSNIKNFRAWVGNRLVASRIIDHAKLEVMNTLVCPRISDSNLAVGNQLITYNVVRDCTLKFGHGTVEDPLITKFEQTHLSHSRKHHDKHLSLEFEQAHLDQLRVKSLMLLKRLRAEDKSGTMVGNVLKRYIGTMDENFRIYKNGVKELEAIEAIVEEERAELASHMSLIESFANPCIVVVGKLEAGTRIIGPVDSVKVDRHMSHVMVSLDPETSALVFTPLPDMEE